MIDINDQRQVLSISQKLYELSDTYRKERYKAAKYKRELDLILATKMNSLRSKKSNLGYETAVIMMLEEDNETTRDIYTKYMESLGKYKGLEKVISALESQISLIQSLIKNQIKIGA